MTAHDRYLAGFSTHPVEITCRNDECGHVFDGQETSEYGQSWTEPEECPECGGSELDAEWLSSYDLSERRAEARGEDF